MGREYWIRIRRQQKRGEFTCIFNVQFNDGFLRGLRGQSGLSEGFFNVIDGFSEGFSR